ncbi:hypothetical protein BGX27_004135 [Mortierella sp. AM989]|nr:hypothetical protein BGX27_004135 [Mortierella sp. AM989]
MVQLDATHFSRDSTSELSAALNKPESFKFLYWPFNAVASTSREILEFGQAKWENLAPPGNWDEEKLKTPFHCLPVLYIKSQNGKDIVLSETSVIEQYLAKTFGLLGDNDYEENLIKIFHSSSGAIQSSFAEGVTWERSEAKASHFTFFKQVTLPRWIQTHEKHLADNGNNGHYVGNKLSLADIRTANAIEHFALQPEGPELMEIIGKSEALSKVRQAVAKDVNIAAWRSGDLCKRLYQDSVGFFANPFAVVLPSE